MVNKSPIPVVIHSIIGIIITAEIRLLNISPFDGAMTQISINGIIIRSAFGSTAFPGRIVEM